MIEPWLQREVGFNYYLTQIARWMPSAFQKQSYGVLLFLLPALVLVFALQWISQSYFSKLSVFLLEITVLLYCLGPVTVYHHTGEHTEEVFQKAHRSLGGVLFWFALLGPLGALLFRLVERIHAAGTQKKRGTVSKEIAFSARSILGYLSWLPIRFFGGIQAILGKFPDTLRYWLDHLLTGWSYHDQFLAESGRVALGLSLEPEASEPAQGAIGLLDKTLLVFLGMMLVYSLVAVVI